MISGVGFGVRGRDARFSLPVNDPAVCSLWLIPKSSEWPKSLMCYGPHSECFTLCR